MKLHRSRAGRRSLLVAWGILACLLTIAVGAAAYAAGPVYRPNEYVVTALPGSTLSAVEQSVAQIGGTVVKPLPVADCYLVRLGVTTSRTATRSFNAQKSPWVLKTFTPNYLYQFSAVTAIPNDPLFNVQWGLGSVNLPRAWAVQKGSASVTVAINDSGVSDHPDLNGRIVPGYDFPDDDADPSNDVVGHGTHVAGIVAAQGDNGMGVSGVCWEGVNIMPVKIGNENGIDLANVVLGLDYAMRNGADVVNMSYGGGESAVEQLKIQELHNAGIILCASAGNFATDVDAPAKYPECIAVASIGPYDQIAPYSSFGPGEEVDIAAPGGDYSAGSQGMIMSTGVSWENGVPTFDYRYMQGTSMASPFVAGAAALLLSAGIPANEVRTRLELSARKPASGAMDVRKYGAGILDVAGALMDGSIAIAKPVKGSTVTDYPDFKINVRGIDPNSLYVYIDYADAEQDGVPDDLFSEIPVLSGRDAIIYLNAAGSSYLFNWSNLSNSPLLPGMHFIYVTATTTSGDTISDWGTFSVASNLMPRGTYLIALPFAATLSLSDGLRHPLPQELLWDAGSSQPLDFRADSPDRAKLIRWSALDSQYLHYLPNENGIPSTNDRSWMNLISPFYNAPTGGGYRPDDFSSLQFPAGSGFWLMLHEDAVIGNSFPAISANAGLHVPLYKGWNLIGNPFTRPVALSTIKLTYQGKTRTLDDDQKAQNPWLQRPAPPKSQFYGYSSQGIPGYVAVSWRDVLQPYQGYWVRALVGGPLPTDRLMIVLQ